VFTAGRHARRASRQSRAALLAFAGAALLVGLALLLGGGSLARHGLAGFVFRPPGTGATAQTPSPAPAASPLPVGVIIPALRHHRSAVITIRVWPGETILIFASYPPRAGR
jgi:hypothetical protein